MSINGIGRPCNWNLSDETDDPNYRPNMKAAANWRDDAEAACERHLSALLSTFENHARRSGRPLEHCAVYLMNGVRP